MEWAQFGILVLTLAGLFFWNRTEARADARHFAQETKELRREMIDIMREFKEDGRIFREQWAAESKSFNEKWATESKEFHGRLCAIEERRK